MLFVAYRAMETRAMTAVKDAGYTDITLAQARIGQRIGPAGTRLTDLAEQAQVTKQTAGFLVDQLERAGYVERVPDPADGRARLIRLSARGAGVAAVANAEVALVEREWEDHLGAAAYRDLRTALLKLREVTDPYR
ncbi:MarR family winged helix-turn-helix transcriptional regulator [Tsukamurella tyrosinosolvens]|uniref:MarR family winged helix-turn-helix transcriptional regulator n=1 Tax=Tsukamurella tyrosinosolvens TaxID=57704 RepID=UPI001AF3ADBB|nr:MarR family transcriptional regulator [Tsukamurella tyrosinosolvens]QRY86797.1 MarR family transcriptional regulator [Tsukamurella tyrosinosolvens]